MSLTRWNVADLVTVVPLYPSTAHNNTNPVITNFDVSSYAPGARFVVLITATPTDSTADTGFNFKLQDTATSGGVDVDMPLSYANIGHSTGGLAAGAVTPQAVKLSFTPQAGRSWITLVGTKVDTDTDQSLAATLLVFHNIV